ncbi:MAG TPA: hypothetical protein VMM78_17675 [Thermomicrobiales bacterium]|nr:hypothetical protein [Thermomicrobiales bacterium]
MRDDADSGPEGQCGLCTHYGEHHSHAPQLIQIRTKRVAPEDIVEECGHPQHAALSLVVTPISGCAAFEPAPEVTQANA